MKLTTGLKAVAVYEAAKGLLVLVAGFGVLAFMRDDLQYYAEQLVDHLHLNLARGYPRIFIDAAANVSDARLWTLAAFALLYAIVRWVEAYGLWRERGWAEWFAVLSGAIYVPAEVYGVLHHVTAVKVSLLVINVVVVAYMIYILWRSRREHAQRPRSESGI
ncbi:MAG TPA: DUF2127 domain-containing protein [Burkholderiales bacterium]|nr:DUF2127 domain-containing protein [Burkholderiales bacterium]